MTNSGTHGIYRIECAFGVLCKMKKKRAGESRIQHIVRNRCKKDHAVLRI